MRGAWALPPRGSGDLDGGVARVWGTHPPDRPVGLMAIARVCKNPHIPERTHLPIFQRETRRPQSHPEEVHRLLCPLGFIPPADFLTAEWPLSGTCLCGEETAGSGHTARGGGLLRGCYRQAAWVSPPPPRALTVTCGTTYSLGGSWHSHSLSGLRSQASFHHQDMVSTSGLRITRCLPRPGWWCAEFNPPGPRDSFFERF